MRIVVTVKYVPDTEDPRHLDGETGIIDRSEGVIDEINARALTWALETRDAVGGEVIALTMGPEDANDVLRRALALGANEAVHVLDDALAGSDALRTSAVLAAAAQSVGFDLLLMGARSTDGQVGAVPAMVAERLGVPHLTYLGTASVSGQTVTGSRDAGDSVVEASAELPAVVSVTEKIAEPKVPGFRGIMGAKRKPLRSLGLAELGLEPARLGPASTGWAVTDVAARPPRSRGEVIEDAGDGAARIADFLASRQLLRK